MLSVAKDSNNASMLCEKFIATLLCQLSNMNCNFSRGKWDYELYLRFDLYTNKHTQWFYFYVENMRAGQTYRFTIVNLYKVW